MPNPIPVKDRVGRIVKPFLGYPDIVQVFQVPFNGLADDILPALVRLFRRGVQFLDKDVWYLCCYLVHGNLDWFCVYLLVTRSLSPLGSRRPLPSQIPDFQLQRLPVLPNCLFSQRRQMPGRE